MKFPGQKEQLWSQIWNAVADIVEVSDTTGRLVYVNRSFETHYGFTAEEAIGRTLSEMVRSEVHSDDFYDDVWNTISRGGVWRGRMVSKARDGRLIHQDAVVSPVIGTGGEITHFVGVKRVVNAQLLLESRLRKYEQLAALGQLAANVAHEVNNPLTWMIANLSFLQEEFEGLRDTIDPTISAEIIELLDDTRQGAKRIGRIVRSLNLSSKRADSVEELPVEVDVRLALDEALLVAQQPLQKHARLVRVYQDVSTVCVPPGLLGQVLLNLLMNAAQAFDASCTDNVVTCRIFKKGEQVVVQIADTGVGIESDHLERIFEPFFTTLNHPDGTGLGLSISRSLVVRLKGELTVESLLGVGTTFTLVLPVNRCGRCTGRPDCGLNVADSPDL